MAPLSRTCLLALAIASAGCTSYVKQEDFNSTVTELRSTDQKLQSEIDALSQKFDALATQVTGMIRVDTVAHFATNDATLSDQDKPLLDGFAKAMKKPSGCGGDGGRLRRSGRFDALQPPAREAPRGWRARLSRHHWRLAGRAGAHGELWRGCKSPGGAGRREGCGTSEPARIAGDRRGGQPGVHDASHARAGTRSAESAATRTAAADLAPVHIRVRDEGHAGRISEPDGPDAFSAIGRVVTRGSA
jgi:outer membrane murein-binding lipoprotein Lpp